MRVAPTIAPRPEVPWAAVDDHFIGGTWLPSTDTHRLHVTDPANGETWGSAPNATPADVNFAVAAPRSALTDDAWHRTTPGERAGVMMQMADLLEQRSAPMALTLSRENGSCIAETAGAAANAASILRYYAGIAGLLEGADVRPYPDRPQLESVVRRDPIGVCALIGPWNFPINLVVVKLAPAMLAGCTVVIKTAPSTPLSARFIATAAADAGVPPGVLNIVSGDNEAGDLLVRHPDVDKVAFTGPTRIGRHIASVCGELLRPVTLELGGKSSALILADADLELVASRLIATCLRDTGQTCYTATRVLAPASRYDEVVEMATATVSAAKVGDPLDHDTTFGPLATARQRNVVLGHLNTASVEGTRATTGGHQMEGPGYFVEPTVLVDVTPSMRTAREEVFGPVLSVLRYQDLDDAIGIANSTAYGLGGVVFGTDLELAAQAAQRMDTGSVGLNFFASNHPSAPFGGRHDSGLGVEYGPEGLHAYLTHQTLHRMRQERP